MLGVCYLIHVAYLAARQNRGHVDSRAQELASEKTSCNIVLKTRQARGRLALQAVGDSLH